MSCILYYSKYCEVSKKYLQLLSKSDVQKDIHFICIDKRVKDANNKTYIILENEQRIVLPENITKVPALLLLTQGYQVLTDTQNSTMLSGYSTRMLDLFLTSKLEEMTEENIEKYKKNTTMEMFLKMLDNDMFIEYNDLIKNRMS
jgi:uncharacterized protein (DUF488 family)